MLIRNLLIILSVGITLGLGGFWLSNSQAILPNNYTHTTLLAQETMLKKLKSALDKCIKDSRSYFSLEGLKERETVKNIIQQIDDPFWEKLNPLENFFALEIVPEIKQKASPNTVAQAYCTALEQLPSDWWGLPGGTPSESGEHLLKIPNIQACLSQLLNNTNSLNYLDGEARTLTKVHQWQISDLAASFLLTLSDQEYSADASVEERNIIKKQLQNSNQ
ncbi:hypothetical protein PCC7424_0770 [Gloeothece citriformis PCC 7424]|uniref:Uncharacterized protein n=1 Tax=Gloeothece citriformis (strain PCC 7424) TaxID=65393 RepID=B7KG33_GLOC7|nr:hypothetical protein [Gloeothece citriformis]ACK69226.1 hypothetical protein PCC7424_0770 [Gloeothece citriformis PCC 7424]